MSAFTASSNGVSPSSSGPGGAATKPVLETHAWDATFSQAAQLTHSYRGPRMPVPPNRLRIFSGTSNPVRACSLSAGSQWLRSQALLPGCSRASEQVMVPPWPHGAPWTGSWQAEIAHAGSLLLERLGGQGSRDWTGRSCSSVGPSGGMT